ncbi:MAG: hypothetical protein JOY90_04840 [Bradyrhizobium sp.]|uniref:hypothetical protein n=1 Tax=Bradyrhizobium sp. TaxID=376 RepID=UPI001DE5D240|nr:hypothetical protein [Bradyrhizobium sp.]MBV9559778.1 hypothetical protein [Bradyrhizobium sp.]
MAETRKRKRSRRTPLNARLATFAEYVQDQANQLPPGPERDEMVRKARQAKVADDLDKWIASPGLQPPK